MMYFQHSLAPPHYDLKLHSMFLQPSRDTLQLKSYQLTQSILQANAHQLISQPLIAVLRIVGQHATDTTGRNGSAILDSTENTDTTNYVNTGSDSARADFECAVKAL